MVDGWWSIRRLLLPVIDHFRFAIAYWHTFCNTGEDPFGPGTQPLPWLDGTDAMQIAKQKLDSAFEFVSKLGVPYYCFHDRDLAPEGQGVRSPRLQTLQEIARAHGSEILEVTAGTAVSPALVETTPNSDGIAKLPVDCL